MKSFCSGIDPVFDQMEGPILLYDNNSACSRKFPCNNHLLFVKLMIT